MNSSNQELFSDVIRAMSLVLDLDEGRKLNHAWRAGVMSHLIGKAMGHPRCDLLYHGGLLHDIGSVGLKDHIIHHAKMGFEDQEAREHSSRGAAIVRPFAPLAPIADHIAHHHEHYDGAGFPNGLKGDEIPIESSILQAGDIIDVEFRGMPANERMANVEPVLRYHSGRSLPPETAEAAIDVLASNQELMADLFDPAGIKTLVYEVEAVPPEAENYSRLDLLGQLLWLSARMIDAKSPKLMGHSVRVAYYAQKIAQALGEEDINPWDVLWCGLLHDIGIMGVPRQALNNCARGESRRGAFERHARFTVEIISNIKDLAYLAYAAGSHHEWYNGTGYPFGSRAEGIPLIGRMLAYADAYDWLTSCSVEGPPLEHQEAMAKIRRETGSRFDPRIAPTALMVLDSCGAGALPLPKEAMEFQRLFMTDQADVASLTPDKRAVTLTPEGRGAMLGQAEEWVRVVLSEKLEILEGREGVKKLLGSGASRIMQMMEGDAGTQKFLAMLEKSEKKVISTDLAARNGVHMEAIFLPRARGWDALLRKKSGGGHPVKRLSVLYQSFLNSLEAIVFTDGKGFITDANKAMLDLYGYSMEELLGQTPAMLGSPGQNEVYNEIRRKLEKQAGGSWSGELSHRAQNGDEVTALVTVNSLSDSTGNAVGHIWHMADITERRNLEKALESQNIKLERLNQLKSDLMAVTSHDLKSPLNVIAGYAGLIKETAGFASPETIAKYLDNIIFSVNRMVKFIGQILDAQKIESGKLDVEMEPLFLNELLQEHVENMATALQNGDKRIIFQDKGGRRKVNADPERMIQVFDNLLSNALKFSPDGGAVEVHYKDDGGDRVEIFISDEGPGIPESDMEKIFDRYFQVKKQGTHSTERTYGSGLGLYISREILRMHGGSISVRNQAEGGCQFILSLPALQAKD
ncbi:PAS/PAC sensor signal transduction histidine kinase [Desulfatibacillum aliphaticivorans]|uniref:histidine kinase n=1 Tax=Desulfatibacillum aliphaticivorans TaxID=218208 RepID=B8FAW8_DESAL|nr:HD domain-containing phosphohydrolase [Desulfatibacillum aliphaticivorans]ACL04054.1 PAS/PAC sensor signal transduction histidine kinase [Desulfatibacillum aliphaticivorans]